MSKNNSSYGRASLLEVMKSGDGRIHFLGAGGAGMSALCCLTAHFGIPVSASDRKKGEYTRMLSESGIRVSFGEGARLPKDSKLVVYSLAVEEGDRILKEAELMGIPTVSRAEYLGAIATPYRIKVGVSGTHGKSTTVAMLHHILECEGLLPTTVSGAPLSRNGRNVHIGSLNTIIFENCEYKDSFLLTDPDVGVFLNLEYDHADYFKTEEAMTESFFAAISKCPRPILNADDKKLREIAKKLDTPPILVGKSEGCDYKLSTAGGDTVITAPDGDKAKIRISVIGDFNYMNAAMAVSAACECGVRLSRACASLESFFGIKGRLEEVGAWCGRRVFCDYAHHPTEIKEGIMALKSATGSPLTLIFGPHTYSRTSALFDDFVAALSLADRVLLTEIDGVREERIEGVSSEKLAECVGGGVVRCESELLSELKNTEGAIAVMGAINMSWVLNALLK